MEKFEELLNEVDGQSVPTLVTYFVGGLKPDLKSELKILKLMTLRQAFSAAKMYEAHPGHHHLSWSTPYRPNVGAGNPSPLLKTPPEVSKALPIVRKTLTMEERRARIAKGLCFNCDKAYSPGHRCKGKLFRMDMEKGA